MEDFLKWNPSLTETCDNFQEGYAYCIQAKEAPVSSTTSKPETTVQSETTTLVPSKTTPTMTTTTTTAGNGVETPDPVQPGIVSNCDKFYLVQKGEGCASIAAKHGITLAQFTTWNSETGANCAGLWADTYACVSIIGHDATPTKSSTPTNGIETPSPIQSGMVNNCNKFHLVKTTTTCLSIQDYYKLPLADFYKWNPAVGTSCQSLLANYYVCVGVTDSTPTPTQTGGIETPSPIQNGMVKDCNKFHLVKTTTTCSSIETYYKLSLSDFYKWNPAVGTNCQSLLANYYVCVGVSSSTPTPTQTSSNGIETPSPIQNGMAKNCNKFHLVKTTTTCASIENYYSLPLSDFYKWNPAVGTNCQSLLANYYVCVSVVGWTPTPTTPGNGISTPTPIQTGMTKNCNKFHLVKSTTTCASIQDYYKISFADFYKWNPAVGSTCTSLWADYNVCVGVIGQTPTPTNPGNGVSTPTPYQAGMTSSCKKFHLVKSTTTCASIQDYYKVTMANLYKWNPAIGSACTSLWANYYVCVGV
ncbi:hypothetical protein BHE90_005106 [Fusarium euwallaceae]|uniref:LysM domain-containing protein n=1 Tax=Fusarium euwallaceae TaxID=1147111 RepID=A0A430LXD9_9HYPO|nr:hypothetical protein BHE90_005106 [Fusarium euwallaceae]